MPFKPKTLSRWRLLSLLPLLIALALAGCGETNINLVNHTPSVLDPKGPIALQESNLFWFILAVSTFVFIAVVSALVYSIIKFRDRPGAAEPVQLHGNTRLEIAWTIVPSLFLLGVLIFTIATMFNIQQPNSPNTITIDAIGHQWWWEFKYEGEGVVTADEMWMPTGTVVHINLISDNVIHSFWVPQLGGKTDVIPGHQNALWLQADVSGWYRGECAEFCGTQHAHMDFVVHAVSPDAYQTWLTQQRAGPAQSTDALAQAGAKFFVSSPCIGCHQVDGVNNSAGAHLIGPNLTHFGSRQWIAGGVVDNNATNLKAWIEDAQAIKPGSDMPEFSNLTPDQVDELVAYLESLK